VLLVGIHSGAALPQFPLPAPDRADDDAYVDRKYCKVQESIQRGMAELARKRALPLFG
jgi:hypothetical protein